MTLRNSSTHLCFAVTARHTVVIAGLLAISAYFVATQPITPRLAFVSSVSVVVFALPSYLAIVRLQGARRGLILLGLLGLYALLVESSALTTGFPYGNFTYTNVLGNKVFGLTPWTVAFAYPPILLLSYIAARCIIRNNIEPSDDRSIQTAAASRHAAKVTKYKTVLKVAGLTALVATACDIVLDPAAVRLGFWYWDEPGFFYGVPLINFAGWLLSSFVGGLILSKILGNASLHQAIGYSGLATLWFWTLVNLWLGQWLPFAIGLGLNLFLIRLLKIVPRKGIL